jgi:hypothetical protein
VRTLRAHQCVGADAACGEPRVCRPQDAQGGQSVLGGVYSRDPYARQGQDGASWGGKDALLTLTKETP